MEHLRHLGDIFYALSAIGTGSGPENHGDSSGADDKIDQTKVLRAQKALKLRDKVSFVSGIMNIGVTCFILGRAPLLFYLWHTPKAITLIGYRFFRYYQTGIHYYVFDFCYYANLLVLVYLWKYPLSEWLFKVCFVFANGPLAWAIVQFRNSLVLHSSDKMTSVFIHLSPALVMWSLRWHAAPGFYDWPYVETPVFSKAGETWMGLVWPAYLPHCLWAACYYVWIFVVKARRIKQKGYVTLFSDLMSKKSGPVYSICAKFNNVWAQRAVYLIVHQLFCFATASLTPLLWNNFYLHTAFLLSLIAVSAWNGANFYMEVFAKRYLRQLEESATHRSKAF